ncbi:hypothetical protein U1Q18_039632 [Sarracenia purpurea var. burkii]
MAKVKARSNAKAKTEATIIDNRGRCIPRATRPPQPPTRATNQTPIASYQTPPDPHSLLPDPTRASYQTPKAQSLLPDPPASRPPATTTPEIGPDKRKTGAEPWPHRGKLMHDKTGSDTSKTSPKAKMEPEAVEQQKTHRDQSQRNPQPNTPLPSQKPSGRPPTTTKTSYLPENTTHPNP